MSKKNSYSFFFLLGISPFFFNGYVNSLISEIATLYWSFELLTWVVVPVGILLILHSHYELDIQEIGFRGSIFSEGKFYTVIFTGLLYTPASLFLYMAFLSAGEVLFPQDSLFHYQEIVPESGIARTIVILYLALSAALVEEFYFRGLLFKAMSFYKRPLLLYLFYSPLLFSLVHWENGLANVFATYLLGFVAATLFVWLRNLWPLVIAHMFTDFYFFS